MNSESENSCHLYQIYQLFDGSAILYSLLEDFKSDIRPHQLKKLLVSQPHQ